MKSQELNLTNRDDLKSSKLSAEANSGKHFRTLILGGGISGLSAAYWLKKLSPETNISLWEASDCVGGVIRTVYRGGMQFEESVDNFITYVPWGLELCAELGLTDHLVQTNTKDRRTYVMRRRKLFPLPDGFLMLAPTKLWPMVTIPLLTPFGKIRAGLELFIPRKKGNDDETIASFARRRLGDEVYRRIVEPLLSGIYAGDGDKISLQATLPRFLEMEKKDRSLILAMTKGQRAAKKAKRQEESGARYSMFVALKEGMAYLPKRLAESLPEGTIQLNRTAVRLETIPPSEEEKTSRWRVTDAEGNSEEADAVICALPSYAAGGLFDASIPDVASFYHCMEQTGCVVVTFAFREDQIRKDFRGMGFVVPTQEGGTLIAGSFSTHKYPHRAPSGITLIRIFAGGARAPELVALPEDQLYRQILEETRPLLDLEGEPLDFDVAKWPHGMPQYHLGHLDRLAALRTTLDAYPSLALCGNPFTGVGIPNCIKTGKDAAERIEKFLSPR